MKSGGHIWSGADLADRDTQIECDVCIIGSGAGGAWLALQLCELGHDVVMLEEGGHHTRRDFDMNEAHMYPKLYQELGSRTTDDFSLTLLQGRSVGGSTTVNWCSSFRTPERVLKKWRDEFGLSQMTEQNLKPHWEAAEQRLHIAEWPEAAINRNNRVLWEGLGKLGLHRGLIHRNVNGCANLGYCGLGCPIDAKQSMLVAVLPDAVRRGLRLFADVSVRKLNRNGRRVTGAVGEVMDPVTRRPTGKTVHISAKTVAVCGGAINSPALLLRSGIDLGGRVGRRTWFHPTLVMLAEFDEPVNAFSGAPQSVYSHHFLEKGPNHMGFFLEVPPVHPLLAATVVPAFGDLLGRQMSRLSHMNAMIALVVDGLLPHETGGHVRLRSGGYERHHLSYAFTPEFWSAAREACREMARIQFAAGARRVFSLHSPPVVLNDVSELDRLNDAPYEPLKVKVVSAHAMGGCPMGADEKRSVVDEHLRVHGFDNLFVVDGSTFPTALGVNPQLTIFSLARWAAPFVSQVA